jgi:hypothetical protein
LEQLNLNAQELSESYQNGYKCGRSWMDSWVPGGPWVFSAQSHDPEWFKEKARQSKQEHADYMKGWHDGYKAQGKDFNKLPGYRWGLGKSDSHGR